MAKVDRDKLQPFVDEGYITAHTHPTADLIIYNYTAKTQFTRNWTEETMMCRGLIVKSDGTIVARPLKKFFNADEHSEALPLEPFTVTEKMDGSLGIVYLLDGIAHIATRGSFVSEQAMRAQHILETRYSDFAFLLVNSVNVRHFSTSRVGFWREG